MNLARIRHERYGMQSSLDLAHLVGGFASFVRAGVVQRVSSRVSWSVQRTVPFLARTGPRSSVLTSWGSIPKRLYSLAPMVATGVFPRDTISPRSSARSVISLLVKGL